MKKHSILFRLSVLTILLCIAMIIGYVNLVKPPVTKYEGLIMLIGIPFIGLTGSIFSIADFVQFRKKSTVVLIIFNLIFALWWFVMHFGIGFINGL